MTLDQIGLKHGTDKASSFHDYLGFYQELFERFRRKATLLEIGVDGGASIRTWLDWFTSPASHIYGIDHNLRIKDDGEPRLHLWECDVTDRFAVQAFLNSTATEFDIVIDDGGHHTRQITAALAMLWPSVRAGGLYIIEDTHTDYRGEYTNGFHDQFIPGHLFPMIHELNNRGSEQCGKQVPANAATYSDIDTITFRKSLVVLRKR